MRIAIVDDDEAILDFLDLALKSHDHCCLRYRGGHEILAALRRETFDLILLDWNMPTVSGMDVLQWIRANLSATLPVLIMTARFEKADIVCALDAGADDYIVKPETVEIIAARVNAALRRIHQVADGSSVLRFGRYVFDVAAETVTIDGEPVALTAKEFALAKLLFVNQHRPLSRSYMLAAIWKDLAQLSTRTLDMHISRVRAKLGLNREGGFKLHTVFGYGYRLEPMTAVEAGGGEAAAISFPG